MWRKQKDGSWRVVFDTGSALPAATTLNAQACAAGVNSAPSPVRYVVDDVAHQRLGSDDACGGAKAHDPAAERLVDTDPA